MRIHFAIAAMLAFSSAHAWETDNVSCRVKQFGDATKELNAESNLRLQRAMNLANATNIQSFKRFKKKQKIDEKMIGFNNEIDNSEQFLKWMDEAAVKGNPASLDGQFLGMEELDETDVSACSKPLLQRHVFNTIASPWTDNLETWGTSASIPRCEVRVSDSIFSVVSMTDSPVAKSAGINPVLKVNGVKIGVDKLSHFMTEGYNYLNESGAEQNLTKALRLGIQQEEGYYGLSATGVKSYADMAANYKGFEFWKSLTDGPNPYFKCENKQWKQVRQFNWADYVDESFDESINCNEYKNADMQAKVDAETAKRWGTSVGATRCPASSESCKNLAANLNRDVARTILHPRCLSEAGLTPGVLEIPRTHGSGGSSRARAKRTAQ